MSITTEINRRDDLFLLVTAASIADALLKLGSVRIDSDNSSNASSASSSGRKRNSPSLSSSSSSSFSTIDTIIPTNNKRSRSNNNNDYQQTPATSTNTIFRPISRPSLGYYSLVGGPPPSSHHNPRKVVSDDEDEERYFNNTCTYTTKFSTNNRNNNNNNRMIPGEIGPIHSSFQSSGFPNPLGAPLGAPPLLPMGILVDEQELCHLSPFLFPAPSSILSSR
ncbi:hypothetical protein FRACYDRAFT_241436 [Fragilariopsis cylindrus CCMP1102]|uniref:Uncharacterized protein n=1 Tax=Fragilariopsis cylindrus CCMP1102 TaxID=635003 RepID=A0A1E7F9M2_9STRA|nr:hypothetical protein FRACYDRAFT_241436 [Fragilariopsis cylindrus CCMP1102]|eukprot:OEU14880.1 hypothetical protein FRACYDRAFT_241436 [Fragilariopsis cylindrus CCMP1102]